MPKQKLGGCNMLTSHKNATSPQTMALDINQPTPHIEASIYYMTAALNPIHFTSIMCQSLSTCVALVEFLYGWIWIMVVKQESKDENPLMG